MTKERGGAIDIHIYLYIHIVSSTPSWCWIVAQPDLQQLMEGLVQSLDRTVDWKMVTEAF